jgi:predicted nicotinamide N-methyase
MPYQRLISARPCITRRARLNSLHNDSLTPTGHRDILNSIDGNDEHNVDLFLHGDGMFRGCWHERVLSCTDHVLGFTPA